VVGGHDVAQVAFAGNDETGSNRLRRSVAKTIDLDDGTPYAVDRVRKLQFS
jgi:hypothetical protein